MGTATAHYNNVSFCHLLEYILYIKEERERKKKSRNKSSVVKFMRLRDAIDRIKMMIAQKNGEGCSLMIV